jgi:hypothetical protein
MSRLKPLWASVTTKRGIFSFQRLFGNIKQPKNCPLACSSTRLDRVFVNWRVILKQIFLIQYRSVLNTRKHRCLACLSTKEDSLPTDRIQSATDSVGCFE